MAEYVIRGGQEGRARLRVIAAALDRSTLAWFETAGLSPGMRCLDVGCGGGDVTLAMARIVGSTGRVLGIDMEPVKVHLARRDAVDEQLANVEFRCGDATGLDAVDEFDVAYARFLLTHLGDPQAALKAIVGAAKPGDVVVVEDLDHSAVFTHPHCVAMVEYVVIYNEAGRQRGGDPEIGPKLPAMLGRAGLADVRLELFSRHPSTATPNAFTRSGWRTLPSP